MPQKQVYLHLNSKHFENSLNSLEFRYLMKMNALNSRVVKTYSRY